MILWLIRHPRTAVAEGVCYGTSDVDPGACFADEARDLIERVQGDAPEVIYSSPLRRCRVLAELIGNARFDERLRELDFGRWEMRMWSEIDRVELDQWRDKPLDWRIPGGESIADLARRCAAFLADLRTSKPSKGCIVTHGGVIRVLACHLWSQDLGRALDFHVPLGSFLQIQCAEGAVRLLDSVGFRSADVPAWLR